MNKQVEPVLKLINSHERDNNIKFFEENHKYIIIPDSESTYTSVTTWCHSHFPKFNADLIIKKMMKGKNWKEGHKYWGLTSEEIKQNWANNSTSVSSAGTNMHFDIECFMNNLKIEKHYTHKELYEEYMKTTDDEDEVEYDPPVPIHDQSIFHDQEKLSKIIEEYRNSQQDSKKIPLEWKYFIKFIKDTQHLKPYRTEWTIYDEDLKLAGSIDMVYENDDGTLTIYDWKRSKDITRINHYNKFGISKPNCHMPDSNFWHYSLQLNTYKHILERKYGKIVSDLFLVRLHPDSEEKNYELIKLPNLKKEIEELCLERKI